MVEYLTETENVLGRHIQMENRCLSACNEYKRNGKNVLDIMMIITTNLDNV